ncbi:MAG: PspC domain-containing protein [Tannerella sp.]|jgi:phage shock protein PspC (stress-responsive transcriptional regulator)|nr:PspC domain-containing protein [Tannerella sp.]
MGEPKRLYRSDSEKMIAGVCGGIAEYFGLDPTLVRLGYILLSVFTLFSGVLAYLILWIVIPPSSKRLNP